MNSTKFHDLSLREISQWISINKRTLINQNSNQTNTQNTEIGNGSIPIIDKLPIRTPITPELWKRNPCMFQKCLLSRLASVKILSHAISGRNIEVMGMLVGYSSNDTIVVKDCYSLPVQGTETRVNAHMESYEYMVQYLDAFVGKEDKIVGWYHSHPGYGCWLSNIDIQTQSLNQNYQDPYIAIVVDPKKSLEEKRLEIGAFRTIPSKESNKNDAFYPLNVQIYQNRFDASMSKLQFKFQVDSKVRYDHNEPELYKELLECVGNWFHAKKMMKNTTVPIFSIDSEPMNDNTSINDEMMQERSNSISSTSSLTTRHTTDVEMDEQESEQSSLELAANPVPGVHFQEAEVRQDYELKKKRLLLLKVKQYHKLKTYKQLFMESG